MAETEFSVLARSCLKARNPDDSTLQKSFGLHERERNEAAARIN